MRTTAALLALCAQGALAFPRAMYETEEWLQKRADPVAKRAGDQGGALLPLVPPPFDPVSQRVSTTGQHAFVAPRASDDRGPCPGLNALANHGYLPHNGKATIAQFVDATNKGFGMSADLATFLAVYGAAVDGDGTSWSIAGAPHTGIGGSHGNYETDSSPTRGDLFQYGSNSDLVINQFKRLYALQDGVPDEKANFNLDVMRKFRVQRFQESIEKNPVFAFQPFTGQAVSTAAYTFIYRFMSNKSAEYPEGRLDRTTLKSLMSIQEDSNGGLTWVKGYEKFPDIFYKRNALDEYSIAYFQTDLDYIALADPRVILAGCNQGKVNTYNQIDVGLFTNGAYTAEQASKNPVCFATALAKVQLPLLSGLSLGTLSPLLGLLDSVTKGMNCQAIGSLNQKAVAVCPGFQLYGGPTAPVTPGAIQS